MAADGAAKELLGFAKNRCTESLSEGAAAHQYALLSFLSALLLSVWASGVFVLV